MTHSLCTGAVAACSARASCPMRSASTPVSSTPAATVTRPQVKLPVACLIQPITNGPTKPPMLPVELMSAMAPAAPAPRRKLAGRVQKIGRMASVP